MAVAPSTKVEPPPAITTKIPAVTTKAPTTTTASTPDKGAKAPAVATPTLSPAIKTAPPTTMKVPAVTTTAPPKTGKETTLALVPSTKTEPTPVVTTKAPAVPVKAPAMPGKGTVTPTKTTVPATTPPPTGVKTMAQAQVPVKTAPPKYTPTSTGEAVASSGGNYCVAVGAYMLAASKRDPEAQLSGMGYSNYHYVPFNRRLKIYHVYAGKNLDAQEASQIRDQLVGLGYAAEISGDRVLVYSYGKSSIANATKSKVQQAGIRPVEVRSEVRDVTLDQLRVGGYSKSEAKKVLSQLRRAGFRDAILVRE